MAHRFTIMVEVELERTEGKFVSREEMAEAIMEAIEGADPSSLDLGEGSNYDVTLWEPSDVSK